MEHIKRIVWINEFFVLLSVHSTSIWYRNGFLSVIRFAGGKQFQLIVRRLCAMCIKQYQTKLKLILHWYLNVTIKVKWMALQSLCAYNFYWVNFQFHEGISGPYYFYAFNELTGYLTRVCVCMRSKSFSMENIVQKEMKYNDSID